MDIKICRITIVILLIPCFIFAGCHKNEKIENKQKEAAEQSTALGSVESLIKVKGIFYDNGGKSSALVNNNVVKPGDRVEDAEIIEITVDSVKFKYGEQFFSKSVESDVVHGKTEISPVQKAQASLGETQSTKHYDEALRNYRIGNCEGALKEADLSLKYDYMTPEHKDLIDKIIVDCGKSQEKKQVIAEGSERKTMFNKFRRLGDLNYQNGEEKYEARRRDSDVEIVAAREFWNKAIDYYNEALKYASDEVYNQEIESAKARVQTDIDASFGRTPWHYHFYGTRRPSSY